MKPNRNMPHVSEKLQKEWLGFCCVLNNSGIYHICCLRVFFPLSFSLSLKERIINEWPKQKKKNEKRRKKENKNTQSQNPNKRTKGRRKEIWGEYRKRSRSTYCSPEKDHDAKGMPTNIRTINKYKQTSYQTAPVNDPVWIQWMKEHQQLRKHTQFQTKAQSDGEGASVCLCMQRSTYAKREYVSWETKECGEINWERGMWMEERKIKKERASRPMRREFNHYHVHMKTTCERNQKSVCTRWVPARVSGCIVCRVSVCDGSFMHACTCTGQKYIFEMVRTMHTLISLNLCVHTYTQIMNISIRSDALAPRPFSFLFLSHCRPLGKLIVTKIAIVLCACHILLHWKRIWSCIYLYFILLYIVCTKGIRMKET